MQWSGLLRCGVLLFALVGCSRPEPAPAVGTVPPEPLAAGSSRAALAGEVARLVKDINVIGVASTPRSLTDVNGTLYFMATDSVNGSELWKSDGTAEGTALVKDLNPGSGNSDPQSLTNINGTLYFSAYDTVNGRELWKSDGTAAGTVLVKDIRPGSGDAGPQFLMNVNGTLYFSAINDVNGRELWKSDGTPTGTVLVKDIYPGSGMSDPRNLTNMNGTLYFMAADNVSGPELWKSDGTAAGTVLVKDINPGVFGSVLGDLTNINGTLYFSAYDSVSGSELWKSDGTAAGTVLVKDIRSGANSSSPQFLTNLNGTFYFSAGDGVNGRELWKSDGTAAGTVLVKDINPGSGDSSPQFQTNINGTFYFNADDGTNGRELWKSDGTAAGTVLIQDLNPGSGNSVPQLLTNVNGTLYFRATDSVNGRELWKSDGTAEGTVLVQDIYPGLGSSEPASLTNVNGTLYFSANNGLKGTELWKSDGTAAGTVLVQDIHRGTSGSNPHTLADINGTLYFAANDGVNGSELWKSDGTAAGTVLVKDIYPGVSISLPQLLTNVNGTLYFSANDGVTGQELWKSDGTAEGTVLVKDLNPGSGNSTPRLLTNINGTLYFTASDSVTGTELWKSDGTAEGTVLVKDINPGSGNSVPGNLTNVNGTLYFVASDSVTGQDLWKSDGTAAGTVRVNDLRPGSVGANLGGLTNVNGTLYFSAGDSTNGQELWKSDGTAAGTVLVKDIYPGSNSSSPYLLTNVNGTLYFSANDGVNGQEVWKSDGTAAGTVLLQDIYPGSGNASPPFLTQFAGRLVFSATTPLHGAELWIIGDAEVVPPTVTCPANQNAKATSASGASVTYPPATATDDQTASPRLTYSLASGSLFALGSTPVTVTATDDSGNTAQCDFTVTVVPPEPTVTAPLDGSSSTSPVAVAGTALAGATVTALEGTTVLGTFTADASGAFGGTLVLDSRVYSVRFTQTLSGATSDVVGPRVVHVQPPAPSLTTPASKARVPGPEVVLEGSALAGARVSVEEAGKPLGSTSAGPDGAFRLTVSLVYGPHTLSLQQEAGGLVGPARTGEFTVIPAPPVLAQPLDGATVGSSVTVKGLGVPLADITLRDSGEVLATLRADASGAFSTDVSLAYGSHTLTAVQRVEGEESDASAPVHLNAVFNRAPVADAQDVSVAEDGRLEVALTGSDADDDTLTFTLRTPPAHGTLEGTPPKLTYVPGPDFHGADRFTFAVSDGELEATATVRLTVTPVNDAPVASALGATTVEGHSVSLTLSGNDIDGDSFTYEVVKPPAHGSLQGTPPEVTYTPSPGFAGGDVFTFRVRDGQSESAPATVSVRVVAATLSVSTSDVSPVEGSAVTFSAALSDASATPALAWDFGDGTTSTEAAPRHVFPDNGTYMVVVRATDADGTRQASLTVTVRNAPPLVEALTLPTSVSERQEVVLMALAVDPAGNADTLEYQWNFGDGSPQASGPTVRHTFRDDGAFTVVLTVRDEDGGETRAQATFTVSNVPPSASTPERQSLEVGETLSLQLSASDVAGTEDALTWKKLSGPGAVTPEGLFTWVPNRADVGEASVLLEVSDDEGGRVEVTLVVDVLPRYAVEAPAYGCRTSGGSSGLLALLLVLGGLAQRRRRAA